MTAKYKSNIKCSQLLNVLTMPAVQLALRYDAILTVDLF